MPAKKDGPVVAAVKKDLAGIRRVDKDLAESGLAASALVLAAELDDRSNSATSKSMCAKALREAMDRLRELAPPTAQTTKIDDIRSRRAARLGRAAS